MKILDCTLRDGGYYNCWNFPQSMISDYLKAMSNSGVDIVEMGLRSLDVSGFKGASAFTTDSYLEKLDIPTDLQVGVMVNASELLGGKSVDQNLKLMFPNGANESPVDVVRIACHVHEFERALAAVSWLKLQGFLVGFNLMQVADRSKEEVESLAEMASNFDIDVLYFADSMGSMSPSECRDIVSWLRSHWKGDLGIHTHDNMGMALQNTMSALDNGVTWLDSTVTGMGRGPGNARTEELVIEIADRRQDQINLVPLMNLIRTYFQPLKNKCGWGSNPYYYLSGKYGIHPTYIQEMLSDSRYNEEDILAVIQHLRLAGGKKFDSDTLSEARNFYKGVPRGTWQPETEFKGRDVLLLGAGPSVAEHRDAIESYIKKANPIVIALNTQSAVSSKSINFRIACHPVRLLADCTVHTTFAQPLITPFSMLPTNVKDALGSKCVLDFGIYIKPGGSFEFNNRFCVAPASLVVAYALGVVTSGKAKRIFMAGFDGYGADDPRYHEMNSLLEQYMNHDYALKLISITQTRYGIHTESVYAL